MLQTALRIGSATLMAFLVGESLGAPSLLAQETEKQQDNGVLLASAGDDAALRQAQLLVLSATAATAQPNVAPAPAAPAPAATPAAAAAPAADAAPAGGKDVEEVMVTGSRIRRKDLSTPAPVAVIDAQVINNSGLITIGEILQNLPSQSNAINVQFNNGGSGATRINLRGIGVARTLVLLNGRRVVPSGLGANASVDLNMIPIEIVERIEVLKDGASAVYGSDAIAGVVNVITKRDFSGVEGSAYYGTSQRGGGIFQAALSAGDSTDRAGYIMSFQYFNQDDLFAGQRDFSKSDLAYNFGSGNESTLGSSAPPEGLIIDRSGDDGNAAYQATGQPAVLFNDPDDGWRQAQLTGNSDVDEGDFYNYQPENYLITPSERYNFFGQGHYDVTDNVRLYAEALYSFRKSDQLLAPTPLFLFFTDPAVTVSADNVYNPFGRDFQDVRRRMVEASNRNFIQDVSTYRVVLGVEGEFPENWGKLSTWRWDFNFNYGRTNSTNINEGQFSVPRLANATGPSFFDAGGIARCGSPGNAIPNCVPLNLFGGAGTITQDMLDYITYTGVDRGFSEQRLFTFETGGEIFELWNRPAGLVLGFQHRREAGGDLPDPVTALGDTTGNVRRPTEGAFNETAGYAEVIIPLLADLPLFELFELQGAFRFFDFDTFGTDFMYKVGAVWKLYSDVSIRGTYSRAFRAPNVAELFQGNADAFPNVTDPCDSSLGRTEQATINCASDGIPDNLVTGQSQLRSIVGGNPNLDPETADVVTAGIVWTPTFASALEGLSVTVDYFNIAIDDAIQSVGADVILNNCYQKSASERSNCDQITRNANFLITSIRDTETNIGAFNTSGIDFALRYSRGTSAGRFGILFDGTWINEFLATQPDGSEVSGKDQYDLGNSVGFVASWRFNLTLQWALKGFGLGWNLRYIRGIRECEDNNCTTDDDGNAPVRAVDPNTTMDVFASYSFSTDLGYTSLRAGINNFTDQEPSKIYAGFLANSDAANYDYLGRYFYVGLSHKL